LNLERKFKRRKLPERKTLSREDAEYDWQHGEANGSPQLQDGRKNEAIATPVTILVKPRN